MCKHSMVTSFDGQEYCVSCNEELGFSERIDEDDDSGEESMRWQEIIEREENSYADRLSEGY